MTNRSLTPVLLAISMAVAVAAPASADVLYNNLPALGTSGGVANISTNVHGPLGNSFSTGATAESLTDVSLYILASNPSDQGSFTVELLADNGSNSPGAMLATIATVMDSSLSTSLAPVDYVLSTPETLTPDTRYWIELTGGATSTQWSFTSTNTGIGVANEYNFYAGSAAANSSFTPYQMQVNADPIPEPASWTLMIVGVLGIGATLRVSRRRGAVAAG